MARASNTRLLLRTAVGAALLGGSLAEARRGTVPDYEERLFRSVNRAPEELRPASRALMQAGTFGATPAFAAVAWLAGRKRLTTVLLAGGTTAWLLAKIVKRAGGRGRPGTELDEVTHREEIGGDLGWVSGHTAVATTLALSAGDEFPAARPLFKAWAAEVGLARMYVGAHLPHDVVGGAGLGMVLSSIIEWVVPAFDGERKGKGS